jgi:hypothetical protein
MLYQPPEVLVPLVFPTQHPATKSSINSDGTCDTDDEDSQPAKHRKRRSSRIVAASIHLRQPEPGVSNPTTNFEAGDVFLARLATDVHRQASITNTILLRESLEVPLLQQNQFSTLNIIDNPFKAFSSGRRFGIT